MAVWQIVISGQWVDVPAWVAAEHAVLGARLVRLADREETKS